MLLMYIINIRGFLRTVKNILLRKVMHERLYRIAMPKLVFAGDISVSPQAFLRSGADALYL